MRYLKLSEDNPKDPKLDSPAVYYAPNEDKVYYFKYEDPYNGHEYVDMGFTSGTMWAKYNVGATSETDTGLYFAWGGVSGYTENDGHSFDWNTCPYCKGNASAFTKYCTDSRYGYEGKEDGLTSLLLEDDAARFNMGGKWSMPSIDDFSELLSGTNTSHVFTALNGVSGIQFTSLINGNTLFIPYAGYISGSTHCNTYFVDLSNNIVKNSGGTFNPYSVWSLYAYKFDTAFFKADNVPGPWSAPRYLGCTVRGVVKKS